MSFKRQRPVHRRIAAAGDHHALAAQVLAAAHVVLHRARCFVSRQSIERWTVGTKRATRRPPPPPPSRAPCRRWSVVSSECATFARQPHHAPPQQAWRMKRRDLAFELCHEFARIDRGMRRNVVDRLLRIQRRALAAHLGQRVDQHAGQLQHAQLEHREQADRAGADDRNVCLDVARHGRRLSRVRSCPRLHRCGRLGVMSVAAASRLIELTEPGGDRSACRR